MPNSKHLQELLGEILPGRVHGGKAVRRRYSADASLFKVEPDFVVFPKDSLDISRVVEFVVRHKKTNPELSLTARSGGTDMSGGAVNESIIVALDHLNQTGEINNKSVQVQPGVYYHDFEKMTLSQDLLLPSYPASRDICKIGGMVSNNAGGEKSLIYGKTDRYVMKLSAVLADGNEYNIQPLSGEDLKTKLKSNSFEGQIYKKTLALLEQNADLIKKSRPKVSKNSTGYNLWDAWDGHKLDLTKIIVGSQGTLGIVTNATFKLVEAQPLSGMVVVFLTSLDGLGELINDLLRLNPTSMESFDDHTLKLAFRFFLSFRKTLGLKRFILLALSFIPVLGKLLQHILHLPKIIALIEFEGSNQEDIDQKLRQTLNRLAQLGIDSQLAKNRRQEEKFWIMRRESFNLLRKNIKKKHTAPFIDDLIVPPETLPQFLPKLKEILERYKLNYTVAGHIGDGNFHIIPIMDLTKADERDKIPAVLNEVTDLVVKYDGSLSGEHNDGMIRGPFLNKMYSPEMVELFKQIKQIFDPENIFNPHKKTDASWEYSAAHIKRRFE